MKLLNINILFALISLTFVLACAPKVGYVVKETSSNQNISDKYGGVDESILQAIQPYKVSLDAQMNEVIGYLPTQMDKERPNSTLLNFMADALAFSAEKTGVKVDGALMNYGGIRLTSIPPGDITVGRMYELMPFDNTMVIMRVDQSIAKKMCNKIVGSGGWPISSGMRLEGNSKGASASYFGGQLLADMDSVTLVMPNYITDGGDNCDFLKDLPKIDKNIYIRDILIDYVRTINQIVPDTTKRITLLP